jgi:signal transduction histidine kinase
LRHTSGELRWISARGEAVRDSSGTIVAVRGTALDITELKELQRLREEWMSVIAHDLRQPIGVIKMAAELLPELHKGPMSENERSVAERIGSATSGLARMVDDLLDLSRIAARRLSLQRGWGDPVALVREAVERLSHVTRNTRVIVDDAKSLKPVWVDAVRFEQILANLLTNAVKYGEKDREITVHVIQRESEVEIAVTNHGPGIPRSELVDVFQRFKRSQKAAQSGVPGLGLGLYIAKGIVDAHGGRIWVDSVPGATTTFHFTIPCIAAEERAA